MASMRGHQRLMFLMFALFMGLLGIGIYQEACQIKEIKREAPLSSQKKAQCAGKGHPKEAGFVGESLGVDLSASHNGRGGL